MADRIPDTTGERGLDCPDGCDVCDPAVVTPDAGDVEALADHQIALRDLWRDLAEKRIEHGVDWPYIVRTLFADLDRAANHVAAAREADRAEERERIAQAIEAMRMQGSGADDHAARFGYDRARGEVINYVRNVATASEDLLRKRYDS